MNSTDELIDYLIANPTDRFSISWRNKDRSTGLHNIDLFFTNDGHLILGLSCIANDEEADEWLKKIMDFCRETNGYITFEQPPPLNATDFLAIVASLK
ncbi:hypothetical protein KK083_07490 [Fulvivirgaceae bacterium PWU4]|uniref:Uncharacterized protein n=1 Tax=Chryseosolibacter histidini TaxID=2782349 RepID=A0AAP2GI41_9BACT|nr:hypothetical protein [Chryseosolibacter histidini]MBT1696711.1 hypothetical protein [Chryseosolibacter histidini]